MQGREHHVARERQLLRHAQRFGVPDLADHDDVGIRAEDGAQAGLEGEAGLLIDRDLDDARKRDLDRVFQGHDLQ